jgi:hypothetical protein
MHFDHKLRGAELEADQEFVASLAGEHGLEFFVESGDVAEYAAEEHWEEAEANRVNVRTRGLAPVPPYKRFNCLPYKAW